MSKQSSLATTRKRRASCCVIILGRFDQVKLVAWGTPSIKLWFRTYAYSFIPILSILNFYAQRWTNGRGLRPIHGQDGASTIRCTRKNSITGSERCKRKEGSSKIHRQGESAYRCGLCCSRARDLTAETYLLTMNMSFLLNTLQHIIRNQGGMRKQLIYD